jgi:CRISPR-associated protein Cas1
MGWRVVYVEESEHISLHLDNIVVKQTDKEIMIPVSDLQTLVLDNYKTTLTVQLLLKLAENNVNVVFCGLDHLPKGECLPLTGHYAAAAMLKKQIDWTDDMKGQLHRQIVRAKIDNQISVLRQNQRSIDAIEQMIGFKHTVEFGDLGNREGLAAKTYFWELFGKDFQRQNSDVINAGLNYGYAILRSKISSILVSKGLNTTLGLFHIGATNPGNLSDDVIEVFRPLVDNYVYQNMRMEEFFKREHKEDLIRIVTKKVEFNGQKQTVKNAMELYIESILNCIELNDIEEFQYPGVVLYDV